MKAKSFKILALALAALIVLPSALGCSPRPLDQDPYHHLPTETSGGRAKARTLALPGTPLNAESGAEVSAELREAVWRFAGKTSKAALETPREENTLYSPVSLYYALGMLEAGTGGETKARLRDFMEVSQGFPLGSEFQKLYARMTHEDEYAAEQTANSVWIKDSLVSESAVEQDWLDQLSEHFYASAFAVDFSNPKTGKEMSAWVEKETKGKIKPEMDLSDPLLLMVLMNTVYFQAEWAKSFEKGEVVTDSFFTDGAGPVEVSYLTRYIMGYQGIRDDRYTAAALPLKRGQVDFILPAEGIDPADLLADPDFLMNLWTAERDEFDLDFKIPKLKYEAKINILESLEDFGLVEMLGFDADFSKMYQGEIAVSGISQQTFIALDEKGVEAAAVTDILIAGSAAPVPHEVLELHLDRPFIFLISDPAGVPLFVGVVRNPA